MNAFACNGTFIHYRASAFRQDAHTLVFINSLGSDFRIWDAVAEKLRDRFNCVFHDKRGHGLSGFGPEPISITTYAQDLEALVQGIGSRNIILCGLSVGGLIAQEILRRGVVDVRGVVLSNTGLKIGTDEMWNGRIASIETDGLESIADNVMERWFSAEFRSAHPGKISLYRSMLSRTPAQGYTACCKAIRDCPGFDHSKRSGLPALCIGGGKDGSTPPSVVRAVAANIPGAVYHEFETAGHLPCIEQPERYAKLIADFAGGL